MCTFANELINKRFKHGTIKLHKNIERTGNFLLRKTFPINENAFKF